MRICMAKQVNKQVKENTLVSGAANAANKGLDMVHDTVHGVKNFVGENLAELKRRIKAPEMSQDNCVPVHKESALVRSCASDWFAGVKHEAFQQPTQAA